MKKIFGMIVMSSLLAAATNAGAGGAVARRQQAQQMVVQQQQQQMAIMQQRALMEQKAMMEMKKAQEQVVGQAIQQEMLQQRIAEEAEVQEVVDLNRLLAAFESSSRPWELIIDTEAKGVVVQAHIDRYRQQGVTIKNSPFHYVALIDSMSRESPQMLQQPLSAVLKILAIIEYDFGNGQDKDSLAYQVLGTRQAVLENRARLGLPAVSSSYGSVIR